MTDFQWFDPGLAEAERQAHVATELVDTAITHLAAGAVSDWSGPAAASADGTSDDVQRLLLSGSADLEEALLLSAALQQEWLLGRWSRGFLGIG